MVHSASATGSSDLSNEARGRTSQPQSGIAAAIRSLLMLLGGGAIDLSKVLDLQRYPSGHGEPEAFEYRKLAWIRSLLASVNSELPSDWMARFVETSSPNRGWQFVGRGAMPSHYRNDINSTLETHLGGTLIANDVDSVAGVESGRISARTLAIGEAAHRNHHDSLRRELASGHSHKDPRPSTGQRARRYSDGARPADEAFGIVTARLEKLVAKGGGAERVGEAPRYGAPVDARRSSPPRSIKGWLETEVAVSHHEIPATETRVARPIRKVSKSHRSGASTQSMPRAFQVAGHSNRTGIPTIARDLGRGGMAGAVSASGESRLLARKRSERAHHRHTNEATTSGDLWQFRPRLNAFSTERQEGETSHFRMEEVMRNNVGLMSLPTTPHFVSAPGHVSIDARSNVKIHVNDTGEALAKGREIVNRQGTLFQDVLRNMQGVMR